MKVYNKLSEVADTLLAEGFTQPTPTDKRLRRWINDERKLDAWLTPLVIDQSGKIEAFYFKITNMPIAQEIDDGGFCSSTKESATTETICGDRIG